MMRRRDMLASAAACLAWPPVLRAQQRARVYRVAMTTIAPTSTFRHLVAAFELGLREHRYTPGKDVVFEVFSAEGKADGYPELVRRVVQSKPDVIITGVNANTLPVKAATQSIPIVMAVGTEVIATGLVRSLAKPGGNITGLTWDVGPESAAKRMELLKEFAPKISRVGIFWEPPYGEEYLKTTEQAASTLGLPTMSLEYSGNIERDFSKMRANGADAVYVHHGVQLFGRRAELAKVAVRHRLATACGSAEVVDAGALLSYGPSLSDLFRRAASYVDRILKGAKPGDLPVERPTKLELVLNAKTAKILGLALPPSLLLRVDRIVE